MGQRRVLSECRCLWLSTAGRESSKNALSPQRICCASNTPGGIVSTAHLICFQRICIITQHSCRFHEHVGFLCPPGPSTLSQTQDPLFHKGEHDSMVCVYTHREAGLEYVIPQLCLPGRHPLTFICKERPFSFLGALRPARFLLKHPVGTSRASLIQDESLASCCL